MAVASPSRHGIVSLFPLNSAAVRFLSRTTLPPCQNLAGRSTPMEPTELFVIREIGKLSATGYWIRETDFGRSCKGAGYIRRDYSTVLGVWSKEELIEVHLLLAWFFPSSLDEDWISWGLGGSFGILIFVYLGNLVTNHKRLMQWTFILSSCQSYNWNQINVPTSKIFNLQYLYIKKYPREYFISNRIPEKKLNKQSLT